MRSSKVQTVRSCVWRLMLLMALVLAVPHVASAAVYYPSGTAAGDNDLDDLDHHYYYAWSITGLSSVGATQTVTNASITFKDMYNWDAKANVLFLDLMDSALISGTGITHPSGETAVGAAVDFSNLSQTTFVKTDMIDQFDLTNGTTDLLRPVGAAEINLSDRSFVYQNTSPTSTGTLYTAMTTAGFSSTEANALISPSGWVVGTTVGVNGGYDYTYNFTAAQLTTLKTYINNGNDIALAFDPDCHFFNDGVSFTFDVSQTPPTSAPEPASMFLLGTGLVAVARNRFKKKTVK